MCWIDRILLGCSRLTLVMMLHIVGYKVDIVKWSEVVEGLTISSGLVAMVDRNKIPCYG